MGEMKKSNRPYQGVCENKSDRYFLLYSNIYREPATPPTHGWQDILLCMEGSPMGGGQSILRNSLFTTWIK
jgi:hypothetical protein